MATTDRNATATPRTPTQPVPDATHDNVHDTAHARGTHARGTTVATEEPVGRRPVHHKGGSSKAWLWAAVAAVVVIALLIFWPFGVDDTAVVTDPAVEAPAAAIVAEEEAPVIATDVEETAATPAIEGTADDDVVTTTVPVVPVEN